MLSHTNSYYLILYYLILPYTISYFFLYFLISLLSHLSLCFHNSLGLLSNYSRRCFAAPRFRSHGAAPSPHAWYRNSAEHCEPRHRSYHWQNTLYTTSTPQIQLNCTKPPPLLPHQFSPHFYPSRTCHHRVLLSPGCSRCTTVRGLPNFCFRNLFSTIQCWLEQFEHLE